jgi:hypothetical protein
MTLLPSYSLAVVRLEQHGRHALLVELPVFREVLVPGERGVLPQSVDPLAWCPPGD